MASILVVDDEAQQRAQMDRVLAQAGHCVEGASGGTQALTRLKDKRYDLLITDLMMEEGTGFEVLEWVRRNAPGMPVVVCSSYASSENLKTFLDANPYRIVRKPFSPDGLLGHVRDLLEDVGLAPPRET